MKFGSKAAAIVLLFERELPLGDVVRELLLSLGSTVAGMLLLHQRTQSAPAPGGDGGAPR